MKATLQAGLRHIAKFEVTRDRTIDFMGEKARVYATPMLVRDVEIACRERLLAHLDAGGRNSVDPICGATHMRFIVDVASTEKRLAAKAAKAGLA